MLRTVLVDDEPDCIHVMKSLLKTYCPDTVIVGEAGDIDTAESVINGCKPDLLLLDIALNNENGFDLLARVNRGGMVVIFVTAWDNHALRAFKYSAVDYLLKPVNGELLRDAVARAGHRSSEKGITEKLNVLMENVSAMQSTQQKLAIPTINGLSFIFLKDIRRLEARANYTAIFLDNGENILTTRGIKEYEDLLPENIFYRVHKAHIINLNKIAKYQKGRGGYLVMEDGTAIEVAQRRKDDFLQLLLK